VKKAEVFISIFKNRATLSISSRETPAVEAMIGICVFTTLSSRGQSVNEQLAILIISYPCFSN